MRLLVSSKVIAKKLSEIPEKEFIIRATLYSNGKDSAGTLTLIAQTTSVDLPVEILTFEASLKQEDVRWDWIFDIVSKVDEQPITLEVHEKVTNVIFQC
jgi:3'-phosphoadenosine 5'-phosphosulfate sulfotransferase (PAPS reductase)/FAD synthetase